MAFSTTALNTMLDALSVSHVSAHTADPAGTGANEVTGGSYARQAITFAAASAGNRDSSNQPVIDIPAGTTVTHLGFWSALTGGNFFGDADITDEAFTNAGTLTVTDADLTLT